MSHRMAVILLVLSFFGYLFCYIPFCHLSNTTGLPPLSILPISSLSCLLTMLVVTGLCGWWRHLRFWTAHERVDNLYCPSGCFDCKAKVTTWQFHPAVWSAIFSVPILLGVPVSYALPGASTMFLMGVLMKSGSLSTAPVADAWNGEEIRRSSWIAMVLCVAAILTACFGGGKWQLSGAGLAILLLYVGGYLGRLRKMRGQKGSMQFFVTEHMLQPLAAFVVVCIAALFSQDIRAGFGLYRRWDLWGVGIFSQGVGLFGGWMLLYKRESSFSMPLNRAGAVIANLVANLAAHKVPAGSQLGAGALVLAAIAALAIGDKEKAAK